MEFSKAIDSFCVENEHKINKKSVLKSSINSKLDITDLIDAKTNDIEVDIDIMPINEEITFELINTTLFDSLIPDDPLTFSSLPSETENRKKSPCLLIL